MRATSVNAITLYGRLIAISLRGQMQYRVSFMLQTLGHLGATGIEFLAILALFQRFSSLGGWTLPQVAVFYGFINISFAFADALGRGFDLFGQQVRTGDFDRLLLRPRSTVLLLLGHELTLKRIGRLLQGAVVLAWGVGELGLALTPERLLLGLWIVGGNIALFLGLVIVQATMCFWTVETLEIMSSFTYGGSHAARYPMNIYDRWLRRLFTFAVPLTCTSYWPVVRFLGAEDPLGAPAWLQQIAPAAGVLFLVGALGAWRFGVRRYTSTGS